MIRFFLLLTFALLVGCSANPALIDPATAPDPELAEIAVSFERTVDRLTSAEDADWRAGWFGNVLVNTASDGRSIGLCHQWRDAVYRGVVFDVRRLGWTCGGVTINRGTSHEHHAVLVARPELGPSDLLPEPPESGAYVLDAWSRGKADIYRLKDWIELPFFRKTPPALVDVGAELGLSERLRSRPDDPPIPE